MKQRASPQRVKGVTALDQPDELGAEVSLGHFDRSGSYGYSAHGRLQDSANPLDETKRDAIDASPIVGFLFDVATGLCHIGNNGPETESPGVVLHQRQKGRSIGHAGFNIGGGQSPAARREPAGPQWRCIAMSKDQGINTHKGEMQPSDNDRAQTAQKTSPDNQSASLESTRDPNLDDHPKKSGAK
jgi:hypothetical protein